MAEKENTSQVLLLFSLSNSLEHAFRACQKTSIVTEHIAILVIFLMTSGLLKIAENIRHISNLVQCAAVTV